MPPGFSADKGTESGCSIPSAHTGLSLCAETAQSIHGDYGHGQPTAAGQWIQTLLGGWRPDPTLMIPVVMILDGITETPSFGGGYRPRNRICA